MAVFKMENNLILAEVENFGELEKKVLMNVSFKESINNVWITDKKVFVASGGGVFVLQEKKQKWKSMEIDSESGTLAAKVERQNNFKAQEID